MEEVLHSLWFLVSFNRVEFASAWSCVLLKCPVSYHVYIFSSALGLAGDIQIIQHAFSIKKILKMNRN